MAENNSRDERWLQLLGWQDELKEEAIMAEKKDGNDKDMQTGRPCKDPQMHALKTAHGTPTRQSELPPYVSKQAMPHDPDETD